VCAAALALVGSRPDWHGPRLRIAPETTAGHGPHRNGRHTPRHGFSLETLLAALADGEASPATAVWPLQGGGWAEWQPARVGMENRL
jgi:hypothetical protein